MEVERRVPLNPLNLAYEVCGVKAPERYFPNVDGMWGIWWKVNPKHRFGDHPFRDEVLYERRRGIISGHFIEVRARWTEADWE